jgi:hypothetical protein
MTSRLDLFVDANALLHYPPIRDIDWCSLCGRQEIQIVFCLPVIREIDKKKSDPNLGARAQRVAREINELRSRSAEIRKGVTVRILRRDITSAELSSLPNAESTDERILFLVKDHQKTVTHDVAVLTEDNGMQIVAEGLGVSVVVPNPETRLANPTSELQRKHQVAVQELDALKNRLPRINIQFSSPGDPPSVDTKFIIVRDRSKLLDADEVVEKERLLTSTGQDELPGQLRFQFSLAMGSNPPTKEQLRTYFEDLQKHFVSLRAWVGERNEFEESCARTVALDLHVINDGLAPADDVDIDVSLPSRFRSFSLDVAGTAPVILGTRKSPGDRPAAPERPHGAPLFQPSEAILELLRPQLPIVDSIRFSDPWRHAIPRDEPRTTVSVLGDEIGGFSIRLGIKTLKHHNSDWFGTFKAEFSNWDVATTCGFDVTITMANHPERIARTIPFLVDVRESGQG